jgi:hypothetical protein
MFEQQEELKAYDRLLVVDPGRQSLAEGLCYELGDDFYKKEFNRASYISEINANVVSRRPDRSKRRIYRGQRSGDVIRDTMDSRRYFTEYVAYYV